MKKAKMVHVNLRIPAETLKYFKAYKRYTVKMRSVLNSYAESMKCGK